MRAGCLPFIFLSIIASSSFLDLYYAIVPKCHNIRMYQMDFLEFIL